MIASTVFEPQRGGMRDILGPLIDLPPLATTDSEYAVIRSIVPRGTIIPLHSHGDRETIVLVEGAVSAWLDGSWRTYGRGEIIEIPPHARHALRNEGDSDVSLILVTTSRMARFFDQISAPQEQLDPSPARLQIFVRTSEAFGYWNGGPEDQKAIGIVLDT